MLKGYIKKKSVPKWYLSSQTWIFQYNPEKKKPKVAIASFKKVKDDADMFLISQELFMNLSLQNQESTKNYIQVFR
jgi:hypothetical protein